MRSLYWFAGLFAAAVVLGCGGVAPYVPASLGYVDTDPAPLCRAVRLDTGGSSSVSVDLFSEETVLDYAVLFDDADLRSMTRNGSGPYQVTVTVENLPDGLFVDGSPQVVTVPESGSAPVRIRLLPDGVEVGQYTIQLQVSRPGCASVVTPLMVFVFENS